MRAARYSVFKPLSLRGIRNVLAKYKMRESWTHIWHYYSYLFLPENVVFFSRTNLNETGEKSYGKLFSQV